MDIHQSNNDLFKIPDANHDHKTLNYDLPTMDVRGVMSPQSVATDYEGKPVL